MKRVPLTIRVRFRAVWALGLTKDRRGFETILKLTRDLDEEVSYDATVVLGHFGDPRAIEPLIELIINYKAENDLSSPAGLALRKLGELSVEALTKLLDHEDDTVRGYAADLLGSIGKVESLERLAPLLKNPGKLSRLGSIEGIASLCGYWYMLDKSKFELPLEVIYRGCELLESCFNDPDWGEDAVHGHQHLKELLKRIKRRKARLLRKQNNR